MDRYSLRLIPRLGAFLPFLTALAALVTALNAFLALLMVPFLPYEVLALTVFIPALTALLNALFLRLTARGMTWAAETGDAAATARSNC